MLNRNYYSNLIFKLLIIIKNNKKIYYKYTYDMIKLINQK
jgi:hypothetical protein